MGEKMHGWMKGIVIIAVLLLVAVGFAAMITATDTDNGDAPKNPGVCKDNWYNNDTCLANVLLEFYPDGSMCKYAFHNCPIKYPGTTCKTNANGVGYCG